MDPRKGFSLRRPSIPGRDDDGQLERDVSAARGRHGEKTVGYFSDMPGEAGLPRPADDEGPPLRPDAPPSTSFIPDTAEATSEPLSTA